ncbi:MAG: hypothetical protein AAGH41_05100 [Pseudomonadota bacterium]
MSKTPPITRDEAQVLDAADPLGRCRALFTLPEGVIYLVGHSLGPATFSSLKRVGEAAGTEWSKGLVGSWNSAGWIDMAARVGDKIAPLIGAEPGDVAVCDSVSVNLFKLAAAALPLARSRSICVEDDEFPTDQYVAEGLAQLSSTLFRRLPAGSAMAALSEGCVLIKSAVNYRSGEIANMRSFERQAQASGGVVIWDLSHATGVVPVHLGEVQARFAAGCTYKYMNGGPGAPSFIFVRRDAASAVRNPIPGWLGHAAPFAFSKDYQPADGVLRFIAGTPGILSLAALDGALDAFEDVTLTDALEKARVLGDLCLLCGAEAGLLPASPDRSVRGGHVSLRHENGYAIVRALAAEGVMADFRTPDTIRFGLSPLFLSYTEVWEAMDRLATIMEERRWDQDHFKVQAKVT